MYFIRFIIDLVTYPLNYPLWWLFFSWLIWFFLKWRKWPKPALSVMLLYSTSVGISYIKSRQRFVACLGFELCAPHFSLFPFLAEVSFWFIVLSVPIALAFKPQAVSEQIRRNWWVAALLMALAVWHASVGVTGTIRSLPSPGSFRLIACDIFFYPAMVLLLPWLFWSLLKFFPWPGPALPTMLLYTISAANASIRLWTVTIENRLVRYACEGVFSLPLFLAEIVTWFVTLYLLMKLTLRVERQATN